MNNIFELLHNNIKKLFPNFKKIDFWGIKYQYIKTLKNNSTPKDKNYLTFLEYVIINNSSIIKSQWFEMITNKMFIFQHFWILYII